MGEVPEKKLQNLIFCNNICIIVVVFSIVCFITSLVLMHVGTSHTEKASGKEYTYGPIEVKDKNSVYKLGIKFPEKNSSMHLDGKVLSADGKELYDFIKDFYHETWRDEDGSHTNSADDTNVMLTLEKGTYFIKLSSDDSTLDKLTITITELKCSHIPHLIAGFWALLLSFVAWLFLNRKSSANELQDFADKVF